MEQFEYLNEILVRFKENDGTFQGAHTRNIRGVKDSNGAVLFAQMADPVGIESLETLNDIFGDVAQNLIVEAVEKDALISDLRSQVDELSYQVEALTRQLSEQNDQ